MFGSLLAVQHLPRSMSLARHVLLYVFGFASGWGIAPAVNELLLFDPNVLIMALTGAMVIFLSFSLTAMMTERRSQLYLGGILSSGMLGLLVLSFANNFLQSTSLFNAEVYLGLLLLAGYVCFDTQVIVERSEHGHADVPGDSLALFTNLFGIFIRLLIILTKNREAERDDRRKKRKNN